MFFGLVLTRPVSVAPTQRPSATPRAREGAAGELASRLQWVLSNGDMTMKTFAISALLLTLITGSARADVANQGTVDVVQTSTEPSIDVAAIEQAIRHSQETGRDLDKGKAQRMVAHTFRIVGAVRSPALQADLRRVHQLSWDAWHGGSYLKAMRELDRSLNGATPEPMIAKQ